MLSAIGDVTGDLEEYQLLRERVRVAMCSVGGVESALSTITEPEIFQIVMDALPLVAERLPPPASLLNRLVLLRLV